MNSILLVGTQSSYIITFRPLSFKILNYFNFYFIVDNNARIYSVFIKNILYLIERIFKFK